MESQDDQATAATGSEMSKNALKKQLKAEEAAKKKAAKDAEKAAKSAAAPQKPGTGVEEEILDPTQYYENRVRMIENAEVFE